MSVQTTIDTLLSQPLELRQDNPYALSTILVLPDGGLMLERKPIVYTKSNKDRYYTTVQGETIWNIAYQSYGNSKMWWIIADVNNLESPFELDPGTSLLIPDYSLIILNNF